MFNLTPSTCCLVSLLGISIVACRVNTLRHAARHTPATPTIPTVTTAIFLTRLVIYAFYPLPQPHKCRC